MASCHRGWGVRGAWGASPVLGKCASKSGTRKPPPSSPPVRHQRWHEGQIIEVELAVTEWSRRLSCQRVPESRETVPEPGEKDN